MDFKDGGQTSRDLQKQTAAQIARKKVLAAYAKSAKKPAENPEDNNSHMRDEPIAPKIDSESWKKYHSAWQDYYQKYYSDYYSKAARTYVEKERLKDARAKAEEEEILGSLARASMKTDKKAGLSLTRREDGVNSRQDFMHDESIKDRLRQTIRKKATENAKKTRRKRHLIPIISGIAVVLLILFLQYNR